MLPVLIYGLLSSAKLPIYISFILKNTSDIDTEFKIHNLQFH